MRQKILYALLALVVSFGLWLYVITVENPNSETTFYNIPVVLDNESVLTDRGLMVLSSKNPTVTLKLSGNRSHLNKLNSSNITLVLDLSRIYDSGEQTLSYTISYPGDIPQNSIEVLSQMPAQIGLTIVERDSKEVPVNVYFSGKAADGYMPIKEKMILSHNTIRVAGPASLIGEIAEARITVDIEGKKDHIDQSFRYTFYDKNGNAITDSALIADVPEIDLTLLIQRYKEIPVVLGNVISGGGANYQPDNSGETKIFWNVDKVTVAGSEQLLAGLDELSLGDIDLGEIDVNDNVLTVQLANILPDGVTVVSGQKEVTITINFAKLDTKTVTITQFEAVNVPQGMDATFITKQMSVVVRGKSWELDWLRDEQVIALVDFSNAELGADNYSVTFKINGEFNTLGVMSGDYTVAAKLTAATD